MRPTLATIAVAAVTLAGLARADDVRRIDLCTLKSHFSDYADQLVEVAADIQFSYHFTQLEDARCKDSGLSVHFPTDNSAHPDLDELEKLYFPSMNGEVRIFGTFRGRVRDNTKQDPNRFFEDGIPFMLLELESVSNVVVRRTGKRDEF